MSATANGPEFQAESSPSATNEPHPAAGIDVGNEQGSTRRSGRRPLGEMAKQVNKKRLALVVGGVGTLVIAAIALIVFLATREPGPTLEDLAFDSMRQAVIATEDLADEKNTSRLDLAALRAGLDTGLDGYTVDVAATDDGTQVGVAAKDINGPTCLLVWSAVGLPQEATVSDPNLLCTGRLALANLR